MKEAFIFKGTENDQARVGVVISDHEAHDFLMTGDNILTNMRSFGVHQAFMDALSALTARHPDVG